MRSPWMHVQSCIEINTESVQPSPIGFNLMKKLVCYDYLSSAIWLWRKHHHHDTRTTQLLQKHVQNFVTSTYKTHMSLACCCGGSYMYIVLLASKEGKSYTLAVSEQVRYINSCKSNCVCCQNVSHQPCPPACTQLKFSTMFCILSNKY